MTLTEERLDAAFSALADPTRRAIVARLSAGEATVKELAEPFSISLQAVSKHIRVLERSGLISQRVDAQRRPCRLELETANELIDWIAEQKQRWEGRLDALEAHLEQVGAVRVEESSE
jgi:DNA-binding transcriptional ArsR family regulator